VNCPCLLLLLLLVVVVVVVVVWCRAAERSIQDTSESAVVTYKWCPLHVMTRETVDRLPPTGLCLIGPQTAVPPAVMSHTATDTCSRKALPGLSRLQVQHTWLLIHLPLQVHPFRARSHVRRALPQTHVHAQCTPVLPGLSLTAKLVPPVEAYRHQVTTIKVLVFATHCSGRQVKQ
jgi:hypothetical protein